MNEVGAFVPGERFELGVRSDGALAGLTFAVKDLFDIAGRRTGGGNPDWRKAHGPASQTAIAVQRLLEAGARVVGKTITDELAYSIIGRNWHYGTPTNGAAPERIPGGSSSGSAAAVSNGLCDFALGTDSGGSVRVPASYCGLFGMRPSYGRIPLEGCMALTPSYDTCGWFARNAAQLERIGHVLLKTRPPSVSHPFRLLVAPEVWSAAEREVVDALEPYLRTFTETPIFADEAEWNALDQHSRNLQSFEAWQTFGEWITKAQPALGPEIGERFRLASTVDAEQAEKARAYRTGFATRMAALLPAGSVMCIPTTPTVAPRRADDPARIQAVRLKTLRFTCMAGMARLPQISVPVKTASGAPCGLSFLARHGDDEALLHFVRQAMEKT